jgi:hypothetical protein
VTIGAGSLLGPCEILGTLGAGEMGDLPPLRSVAGLLDLPGGGALR